MKTFGAALLRRERGVFGLGDLGFGDPGSVLFCSVVFCSSKIALGYRIGVHASSLIVAIAALTLRSIFTLKENRASLRRQAATTLAL
jgi:hypothetical protein